MSDFIFLFDLDSTITKVEILPTIAEKIGKTSEIKKLTEKTMMGELPFKQSFIKRVELLKEISVKDIQDYIYDIPLNDEIVSFITANKERCFVVTGNLNVWIEKLMRKLGLENNYFSSKALVKGDYIEKIVSVIDKDAIIRQFITPCVVIGDGNNDAEMMELAVIGIGFGGVRRIAPSILECASHAVYEEKTLCQFLERLL